jgi:hypothetical protein
MSVHYFGIRHHGPGSARSLVRALDSISPDVVLIEGPPEADELVHWVMHDDFSPPVAILIYDTEQPAKSVYYPFAKFSPEYQALRWAAKNQKRVRFIDFPQKHWLARELEERERVDDPLGQLAEAAGYSDGERWWEHLVEERRNALDIFAAVTEAMQVLRTPEFPLQPIDQLREAWMRQEIRSAQKEPVGEIAVVCGAWHVPALMNGQAMKADAALLRGLRKVKVRATWVPWTHGRLQYISGYGAGVRSPGWYEHLWTHPDESAIRWVAKVARLLRKEEIDASSAQAIETVRLAETLASLRNRAIPGLDELSEAVSAVLLCGDPAPLALIHRRLIVGERLGAVPEAIPAVPLQQDLIAQQKRLRFPPDTEQKVHDFDLRKETDLGRSQLLHRLRLLGIPWGLIEASRNRSSTFHELWRVEWHPEFVVNLIEASPFGNTIENAATAKAREAARAATTLAELTALLGTVLNAGLSEAAPVVLECIASSAAIATDVNHLMDALPALVRVARYGDVRQTQRTAVHSIVGSLITRISVGLLAACSGMSDEAAEEMDKRLRACDQAVRLMEVAEWDEVWSTACRQIVDSCQAHGLTSGCCCRILRDCGLIDAAGVGRHASLELSPANDLARAAAWIEGFLKGSGMVLLVDEALWMMVDEWVQALPATRFTDLLPVLRRTFSTFPRGERRQLGERVRVDAAPRAAGIVETGIDVDRAQAALPVLYRLLGLEAAKT